MYAMPPYPYLATDYGTQLSLFTHHTWIGGFCIVGAGAHAAIFMVRDYDPTNNYNNLLDRVIRHRDAIISHLNWVCIFLGFHSFGLYIHNDTMSALGRPQDMFSDTAIQLQPVFAQWIQNTHFLAPQFTAPNALAATSLTWGGDLVAVGGKVAMMPISLGTSDFLVWLMLDQVKLRYMLEQPVYFSTTASPWLLVFFFIQLVFDNIYQTPSDRLKSIFLSLFGFRKKSLFGPRKNLVSRANQQEISCLADERSSETTREASVANFNDFDFSEYEKYKPSHVKNIDQAFLTWLIGFIEGDGSFWSAEFNKSQPSSSESFTESQIKKQSTPQSETALSKVTNTAGRRAYFEITQSIENVKLIHLIRTKLGFGLVQFYEANGFKYCRWTTSKREHIIKLLHLLNGNLILEKRRERFIKLHAELTIAWDLNIPLKPFTKKVSLDNAWLSGFSDADAGFYTNVGQDFKSSTKKPTGGHYVKFLAKYYITQLGEVTFLKDLASLVNHSQKINIFTHQTTKIQYNRLEIVDPVCLSKLIDYFSKFPLRGVRKIACLRWARVFGYNQQQRVLTEKAAAKLARLVESLTEPEDLMCLKTFALEFSPDEKEIIESAPYNQRSPFYIKKKPNKNK